MAGVKHRKRVGVEDGRHGEQDRAERSRGGEDGNERKTWGKRPTDGLVRRVHGPDIKVGGERETRAPKWPEKIHYEGLDGKNEGPPNTVPMEVLARGRSAPGGYRNTGDKLDINGSVGNTRQAAYNEHDGHPGKPVGKMLAQEKSNFYNELGEDKAEGEGESGSGLDSYDRHIEGFGTGRDTFTCKSNFYNDLGEGHEKDAEANSGSGVFKQGPGGKPKGIRGFDEDTGEIKGFV